MTVLTGYRVLDCSIAMAGPMAAARLGDLGADVIKIEPVTGEWHRHVAGGGAQGNQINASFTALNRNKRSLAINLKSDAGRDILHQLAATADVFLQNYRPGVAARLGVDYDTLRQINPRLVYVSMSGYGEHGPDVAQPGQDLLLQGRSGMMFGAGSADEPPQSAPSYMADAASSLIAFEGALAGLLHRERTGEGQLITVNMLDAIIGLQLHELSLYTDGGVGQDRTEEPHANVYADAPNGAFRTRDDRWITLASPNLDDLADALHLPALRGLNPGPGLNTDRDHIHRIVADRVRERDAGEWLRQLQARGLPAEIVHGYADTIEDPQVLQNESMLRYRHPSEGDIVTPGFPIKFSKTPSALHRPTPQLGEHTTEILEELGWVDRVDALVAAGVVAVNARRTTPVLEQP